MACFLFFYLYLKDDLFKFKSTIRIVFPNSKSLIASGSLCVLESKKQYIVRKDAHSIKVETHDIAHFYT